MTTFLVWHSLMHLKYDFRFHKIFIYKFNNINLVTEMTQNHYINMLLDRSLFSPCQTLYGIVSLGGVQLIVWKWNSTKNEKNRNFDKKKKKFCPKMEILTNNKKFWRNIEILTKNRYVDEKTNFTEKWKFRRKNLTIHIRTIKRRKWVSLLRHRVAKSNNAEWFSFNPRFLPCLAYRSFKNIFSSVNIPTGKFPFIKPFWRRF